MATKHECTYIFLLSQFMVPVSKMTFISYMAVLLLLEMLAMLGFEQIVELMHLVLLRLLLSPIILHLILLSHHAHHVRVH